MENFIIYIAKASGLMALFILAYYAFLRKETFFNTNRWYLLAGLVTSALLPFVVYTKVIWVEPAPVQQMQKLNLNQLVMLQQTQQMQNTTAETSFSINWFYVLAGVYMLGVLFFLLRFVIDIHSVRKFIKGQPVVKDGRFRLVDSPKIKSPFSFFNYIVYNSAILKPEELDAILTHERVHSSQKHSLDMIISQLFCTVFWFNPFAWMYKKSISQNLEFIADAEATKQIEDKKAYQKTLLKITVHPECIAITNHFYQSLIKKRIVMLNRQQSKKRNLWKYVLVLPALVAFILAFQVKTIAQEKNIPVQKTEAKTKLVVKVTKDSKDEELEAEKKSIKEEFNADVNFQNIKRNENKEITAIKVTVQDQGQSQVYEVSGNSPIAPFTIEIEKDNSGRNSINFGSGNGGNQIYARSFIVDTDRDSIFLNGKGTIKLGRLNPEIIPPAPPVPYGIERSSGSNLKVESEDMLVVIDGVKKGKGETALKRLNSLEIASITILKGKDAKKKYGKDGKKGVVEITTQRSNNRLLMRHPQTYRIEIPDMPDAEAFTFDFDMPDMPDMEHFEFNFGEMEDMEKFFKDENGDVKMYRKELKPEDMAKLQAEIEKMQQDFLKNYKEQDFSKMWQGLNRIPEKERAEVRKEIEEARKEMEKVRKELEEARKELQKTRASMNKKA